MSNRAVKTKLKKAGYSYSDIAKHSGIKLWKLKSYFSNQSLSDSDLLQVINAIDSFLSAQEKIKEVIKTKTKKILQH